MGARRPMHGLATYTSRSSMSTVAIAVGFRGVVAGARSGVCRPQARSGMRMAATSIDMCTLAVFRRRRPSCTEHRSLFIVRSGSPSDAEREARGRVGVGQDLDRALVVDVVVREGV